MAVGALQNLGPVPQKYAQENCNCDCNHDSFHNVIGYDYDYLKFFISVIEYDYGYSV